MGLKSSKKISSGLELERLFKDFLMQKFPVVDGNQELEEAEAEELGGVHGELVLFDADVAAAVKRVLESRQSASDLLRLPGLQVRPELEKRIEELAARYGPDHDIGRGARLYATRYNSLKELILAARLFVDS